MACRVDGRAETRISVLERALQYGDGLFETLRVCDGRPQHLQRHLTRLQAGCERLRIGGVERGPLVDEIRELAAGVDTAVLKLIVGRGHGARGYGIEGCGPPRRILCLHRWPQWPAERERGIRARICETRLSPQPLLAGIKHLNRLEQVLARAEWSDPAIAEGLMLDRNGRLVEGTMSNVFLVHGDTLVTPRLDACGVAGVMRSVLLDCASALGITTEVRAVEARELREVDELFVCNSLIGLWPVIELDGRSLPAGPLGARLQSQLEDADNPVETNWYPE
ncbi:MAG TPA: aminodeoxychorismate lyase [Gammaproteobacteria bacterium]|nr:aminodeoxychorismate lyase [Gammaproteobacteria bacterium]